MKRERARRSHKGAKLALPACAALLATRLWENCYLFRAVEQSPVAVIMTDVDGTIEYVNPGFTALTGYAPNEVIGEHVGRLGGAPREQKERLWEMIRAGREWRGQFRNRRKDGQPYWVSASISPIRNPDGMITHFLGLNEDITERKEAEEALRESEERYRDLYEEAPLAYFSVGVDGRIRRHNRHASELLGYAPGELVGQPVLDLYADTPMGKAKAQRLFRRFRAGEQIYGEELEMRTSDGRQMWITLSVRPLRDRQGRVVESRSIVADITERKRAEEALREARAELESSVERQMERATDYGLTFRELTVLHLVAAGRLDREIATLLGISPRTVETHVANILKKMDAATRTEAGVRALREGLIG